MSDSKRLYVVMKKGSEQTNDIVYGKLHVNTEKAQATLEDLDEALRQEVELREVDVCIVAKRLEPVEILESKPIIYDTLRHPYYRKNPQQLQYRLKELTENNKQIWLFKPTLEDSPTIWYAYLHAKAQLINSELLTPKQAIDLLNEALIETGSVPSSRDPIMTT